MDQVQANFFPIIMTNFSVKIITDPKEAEKLWQLLSPKENIYDLWDFRYCFYKYDNYELNFYAGYVDGELMGLMPLQYDSKGYLDYFGGDFMESNRIFTKPGYENYIPNFYASIERIAKLDDIVGSDEFTQKLDMEDYKYTLNLDSLKKYNDFIEKYLSGKAKKNLKREIKQIKENELKITENDFGDLDLLIDLNISNFKDDSYFVLPNWRQTFHDLIKLNFDFYLITISVNGKKQAVSLSILYNGVYSVLAVGSSREVPNIGKYLTLKNFQKAIDLKAKTIDFGMGDCGWKKHWNLEKTPQFEFYKRTVNPQMS